jgi:hypothetical protein
VAEAAVIYPWEREDALPHVKARQPVWNLTGPTIRIDLPKRRAEQQLPRALQGLSYGAVVMTHRGNSNGRLSILLSSIPENFPVVVSSDSIDERDVRLDSEVAKWHGADFSHSTPWAGRAGHAIQCMEVTSWDYTLFLNDDVWLFPEATLESLRWAKVLRTAGLPLACLAMPGFESYHDHKQWGFESWQECLDQPFRFEAIPPHPKFLLGPAMYLNPFGACMIVMRDAYEDVGGFAREAWSHDDTLNHRVWLSRRWVNAAMPGRGYVHYGAQSNHFGETQEWMGSHKAATGMTADESGAAQREVMVKKAEQYADIFLKLGGTPSL